MLPITVLKKQWEWALKPNSREKPSFFKENFMPLFEKGHLEFIHEPGELIDGIRLEIFDGHTRGQIIPLIRYNNRTVVFTADFISSPYQVHVPFVSGYDTDPLLAMEEKEAFLEKAVEENYILFFEHDFKDECCTVHKTEKGFRAKETFKLEDIK